MRPLTVLGIPVPGEQIERWLEFYATTHQPFRTRDLADAVVGASPEGAPWVLGAGPWVWLSQEHDWVQLDQFADWLALHTAPGALPEATGTAGQVLVWQLEGQLAHAAVTVGRGGCCRRPPSPGRVRSGCGPRRRSSTTGAYPVRGCRATRS